jgi:hypothetical protein
MAAGVPLLSVARSRDGVWDAVRTARARRRCYDSPDPGSVEVP